MRRKDREVRGMNEIIAILDKCEVMRLAMSVDNKPYIVPLNFAYEYLEDELHIFFHCATTGKKLDYLRNNQQVCFEVDCSYKTITNAVACNWSAEFESVIGEGIVNFVDDMDSKKHALDILMERYGFEGLPVYKDAMLEAVTVLALKVENISGKSRII